MTLQKINWTQIDTLNIPSGYTVNLGSISTPLDGVITDDLIIQGVNFFAWLQGNTGSTTHYAILESPNEFLAGQTIYGDLYLYSPTGETSVNLILSGSVDSSLTVTGSTGSSELNDGYLILRGQNDVTGIPYIALLSNNPLDPSGLYILLNGVSNNINPIGGPAVTQLTPSGETITIIGFESLTGWTYGTVTFYTPVEFLSGVTITGTTSVDKVHFNTDLPTGDTYTFGDLHYDPVTQGLSFTQLSGKTLNIGEETWVPLCHNFSGELIPNGYPVYITGSDDVHPTIEIASHVTFDSSRILGIATEDIPDGQTGRVTRFGMVNDIILTGFTEGDIAYLGEKRLTPIRPISGDFPSIVGTVIVGGTNGKLLVNPFPEQYTSEMFQYSSFSPRVSENTTMSFVDSGRTFTISTTDTTFYYYYHGVKYIKTGSDSLQISDVYGMHLLYYSGDTICEIVQPDIDQTYDIYLNQTPISVIWWHSGHGVHYFMTDDRHTIVYPCGIRAHDHTLFGLGYVNGFSPYGITIGDGDLDIHAQFGMSGGTLLSEDIYISDTGVTPTQGLPILYRTGSTPTVTWEVTANPGFSILTDSITSRAVYNLYTGGTWTLEPIPHGRYGLIHVFGGNNYDGPRLYSIVGLNYYLEIEDAENGATKEGATILRAAYPYLLGVKHLVSFIIETRDNFDNSVKTAIIQPVEDLDHDWIDFRTSLAYGVTAGTGGAGSSGTSGTSGTSGIGAELYVANNTGLGIITGVTGDTIYSIYNTNLDPTLSMPTDVGGIPDGTTVSDLTGKTIVQIIDDLLFPTVEPTYTIPTITITGVVSQTLEAGSTYAPSISVYGNKNDAGPFTQLRILRNGSSIFTDTTLTQSSITDIAAQFGYDDPNNPNYRYTISPTPYSESYTLPSGASSSTTYQGDGNYDSGLPKLDNKGNTDTSAYALRQTTAPQLSGNSFTTSTYTITSIFPYFYGNSDILPTVDSIAAAISGGTATKVISSASGTLSIPYNVTGKYIWVAYQDSYTTKTKWYVTALDNGNIDGSFITTAVTVAANSPNGYWNGITFKVHWSVYSTTQTTLEYRNS